MVSETREIKFRRAYFEDDACTKFTHFSTWGVNIEGMVFKNPATNNFAEVFIDQQYTGRDDCNGTPIYEGDVFDCIYKRDGCKHRSIVYFEAPGFRLKYVGRCQQTGVYQSISDGARYGVVGNVCENPELLNQRSEK